jgi:hypothetical protein
MRPPPLIAATTAILGGLLLSGSAAAHSPGESLLHLSPGASGQPATGRWEIALRDLDDLLGLDSDGDGAITLRELNDRGAAVAALAPAAFQLSSPAGPCPVQGAKPSVSRRGGVPYAVVAVTFHCPGDFLEVDYALLPARDRLHRAVLQVSGAAAETAVARSGQTRHRFPLGARGPDHRATFLRFVREGLVHIWQGPDHLLFLLVLLLPAVLRRRPGGWVAAPELGGVLRRVLKVVTAFTAAHSLTLTLAALGVMRAAPEVIEPAIASSVLLAALANLWPAFSARLGGETWTMAFGLGLLHGFGFSSVLAELGLPAGGRLAALVGFNLGVELGQLALVLPFVPLAFLLRRTRGYRLLGLQAGSALTALVAAFWLVERTLPVR